MIAKAAACLIAITFFVLIAWSWVAFISQLVSRRRGTPSKVPWPDEVLWARTGRTLLDLGFFEGAPVWEQRLKEDVRRRQGNGAPVTRERHARSRVTK